MVGSLIDLHCHILPGLDDGCRDFEAALDLARHYVDSGFATVVATPHYIYGSAWTPRPPKIASAAKILQQSLDERQIPLTVLVGMEIAVSDQFWDLFKQQAFLALGESNTYLIEFPFRQTSLTSFTKLLASLATTSNHRFLIAHPERCECFQNDFRSLAQLHGNGCLLQLNIGSLLGWYGKKCRNTARQILQNQLCHVISTDSHDPDRRSVPTPPELAGLKALLGEEVIEQALHTNPKKILHNGTPDALAVPALSLDEWQQESRRANDRGSLKKNSVFKTITSFLR